MCASLCGQVERQVQFNIIISQCGWWVLAGCWVLGEPKLVILQFLFIRSYFVCECHTKQTGRHGKAYCGHKENDREMLLTILSIVGPPAEVFYLIQSHLKTFFFIISFHFILFFSAIEEKTVRQRRFAATLNWNKCISFQTFFACQSNGHSGERKTFEWNYRTITM